MSSSLNAFACSIQQLFARTHRHLAKSAADGIASFVVSSFASSRRGLVCLNVLAVTFESYYLATSDCCTTHSSFFTSSDIVEYFTISKHLLLCVLVQIYTDFHKQPDCYQMLYRRSCLHQSQHHHLSLFHA